MRFISSNCLRPGQRLAKDIAGPEKSQLFIKNLQLTHSSIRSIQSLGIQGVYVKDDNTDDLVLIDNITEELLNKVKKKISCLVMNTNSEVEKEGLVTISDSIEEIMCYVLKNKDIMINIADLRTFDKYTYCHSLNVCIFSVYIGKILNLSKNELIDLALGALLHDIGKAFIPKGILNKPCSLSPSEYERIKMHSQYGFEYAQSNIKIPTHSLDIILSHHEQFNGQGYPNNLLGNNINIYSRIVSIADVFDALTSDRPYRKALLPSDAIEYLLSGSNSLFDPNILKPCLKNYRTLQAQYCQNRLHWLGERNQQEAHPRPHH